jgi:adenylate cyclase
MRNLLQSPLVVSLITCALVFLAVVGLRSTGGMEALELAAYDWFLRLQPKTESSSLNFVLIEISEDDIRNQEQWPISDATLAQALEILTSYQARVIGMDLFRDIPVPPGNDQLDAILKTNSRIITVMKFGSGGVPAPKGARDPDQIAFNDMLVDADGTVRRGLLFLDDGEEVSYSLAMRTALISLQRDGILSQPDVFQPEYLKLGRTTIPPFEPNDGPYINADARGYQFLIDCKDDSSAFPSYSLTALLSCDIDPGVIRDKIVMVGLAAQSVKDFFHTPCSRSLKHDQMVSGIALHANNASQILRWSRGESEPIKSAGKQPVLSWILLWSVVGGAVALWVSRPWGFAMASLGMLLALGLTVYLASLNAWWLPLAPPALAWFISAILIKAYVSNYENKQRAVLMQIFSRHVSPKVAEVLWQEREQFMDGGRPRPQQLTATVLFSDLKGFTQAIEKMAPQALNDWINAYMEALAQVIMQYGGIVNDYAGDGIKADFGVPLARTTEIAIREDAVQAVNCALAMEKEIVRINEFWQEQGLPTVRLRIGINTGPVVAGTFGNARRLKYTTIGDTVNVASRLESYDKDSFDLEAASLCRILISEATLRLIDHHFAAMQVGEVMLKGKSEPISVYRIFNAIG